MIAKIFNRPIFYILLIIAISLLALNVRYPMVGCDYVYFVPRLLDSYVYYLNNGLDIQWWTPSFGGGLPSYPNPQQMQFSLQQFLTFMMNPWLAINATIVFFTIIGYYSMIFLFSKIFRFPKESAILGAVLFSVTGIFIERLAAGQISYFMVHLLPLLVILLLYDPFPIPIAATGLALIFACLIHSGGFYLVVFFSFSASITVVLYSLLFEMNFSHIRRLFATCFIGFILGTLLNSSKFVAVASFMRFFPRHVSDTFHVSIWKALLGILGQLFFAPVALFHNRLYIGNILRYFTGAHLGLWELDIGLSPIILGIFLSSLVLWKKTLRIVKTTIPKQKFGLFILLVALIWITVEFSIARGYIYWFLKQLPVIRSLRANMRFVLVFILPLTIFCLYLYKSLTEQTTLHFLGRINLSLLLAFIAIIVYSGYIRMPIREGCIKFNISQSIRDWDTIRRHHDRYRVKYVGRTGGDSRVFLLKTSNLYPYEPIFDPAETFAPKIKAGLVEENDGRFFNLTNPASLVFPEENELAPFERISLSDAENFEKFVTYQRPNWKLSRIQHLSNHISLWTLIGIVLIWLYYFLKYLLKRKGKEHG